MKYKVLFIDDDEIELRTWVSSLKELFGDTDIEVVGCAPFQSLSEYSSLVTKDAVSALLLDHVLVISGAVTYSGAELAAHLRSIGSRVPIYIMTNYVGSDSEESEEISSEFTSKGWAVEEVLQKKAILRDPTCVKALNFKARLTRQIQISGAVLAAREQRYHDLLIKSSRDGLSAEETKELQGLEDDRILPVLAEEREEEQRLDSEIDKLKKLLGEGDLI